MRLRRGIWLAAVAIAPAVAQEWQTYRGRITGGGGERGKCTIEVRVDDVAEIEIAGADGRMRTLSGAPASWTRMQCNQPMPANPREFKFSGIDGRGNQYLVRAPGQNRGVALVRIEDKRSGSEGYTFDLEWRGSAGPASAGGSIFDPPTRTRNPDLDVDFSGPGDGYYRTFRGGDELLRNCTLTIDGSGRVEVEFSTNQRSHLLLAGRVVHREGNRVVADMAGGPMQGTMEILLGGRGNVEELAMTGVGRNRLELRWTRR